MESACGGWEAAIERARERKLRRNGIEGHRDTEYWCRKFPRQTSASCTTLVCGQEWWAVCCDSHWRPLYKEMTRFEGEVFIHTANHDTRK